MRHKIVSVTYAKAKLSELTKSVAEDGFAYLLTKDGEPVSVIVPFEDYEAMLETDDIMSNQSVMKSLSDALEDEKLGRIWSRDKKGKWSKTKKRKNQKTAA